MNKVRDIVNNSPEISDNDKYYWNYMYDLGKNTIVPLITKLGIFKKGDKVAEIGSAEGGVLAAFVESGAENALATDIAIERLETGKQISELANLDIEFTNHDIINQEPAEEWKDKYDLVLLRDVIEHLDDTYIALLNIKKIIKKNGVLYVTFPPYHSPYGGHQHTLKSTAGNFPFIHLLPRSIFYKLIKNGREKDIIEVKRLSNIRLTIKKFEDAATKAGYTIEKSEFYLLRPVFKAKFGLPALKINVLSKIPILSSLFTLEASYILRK